MSNLTLFDRLADTAPMPALFLGHGSPMNIIQDNSYTRSLAALGRRLPRPAAILVVSAHWMTSGVSVGCMERPRTIHDFYGFPRELYERRYACPGAPAFGQATLELLREARGDLAWGLDHAAWAVLTHLYPQADIPVFELSLDLSMPARRHFELGRLLRPLRRKGVLILGSGNIVHNLRMVDFRDDAPSFDWAVEADELVKAALLRGDYDLLIDYQKMGRPAALAIPTPDHYLPMLYTLALQEPGEALTFVHEGMQNGSIAMRCLQIG